MVFNAITCDAGWMVDDFHSEGGCIVLVKYVHALAILSSLSSTITICLYFAALYWNARTSPKNSKRRHGLVMLRPYVFPTLVWIWKL
jgi:hypothetical protein